MGEKVTGAFEFGYELVEPGIHIMSVETADVVKKDNPEDGWVYKVRCKVQGGESDGRGHFEQFITKSKGNFGLRKLVGFLIKTNVLQAKDYDSDTFETEQFGNKFKQATIGKLFGVEIIHQTTKMGKVMSNSKAYYTVKEAQDKLNGIAPGKQEKSIEVKKEEPDDDWK
ncbi:hypothetical protein KKG36_01185 [Patescibacteria group bacterium]|nr:hypothetical protein [Patescibacteria group bacterium]